jgi:hypothetical protein
MKIYYRDGYFLNFGDPFPFPVKYCPRFPGGQMHAWPIVGVAHVSPAGTANSSRRNRVHALVSKSSASLPRAVQYGSRYTIRWIPYCHGM